MPKLSRPIQYVPKSNLEGLGGGSSDHGTLTGLGDDDHSQYHNDTRGDARYYTQAQVDALNLTDFGATAHRTFYSDGAGAVTELAHGTSTHVLTSNGASSAPSWQAAAGGGPTNWVDNGIIGEGLYNTVKKIETTDFGISIYSSLAASVEAFIGFHDNLGVRDGFLQMGSGADTCRLRNETNSGTLQLEGTDSSSVVHKLLQGDPDGVTNIFYDGDHAFGSDSLGMVVYGVTDTQPRINFLDGDGGTQVGNIRATSTGFVIDNRRVSGHILLRAKNSVSSVVNTFLGDPDAESSMYYNGSIALSTISGSIKFGTHTGIGAETVTGYITVQDSGGTSRKIAVVS